MSSISEIKIRMKYCASKSRTEKARRLQPNLDREYIVPVLLKSVQILDLLGDAPDGLRIEQIHRVTGISKTTVYRIVRTFVVSGHLCHGDNGAYAIARQINPGFDISPYSSGLLISN